MKPKHVLVAVGTLAAAFTIGVSGASAAGKGTAICQPAGGIEHTFPAGGPAYAFFQPPPYNFHAANNVCGF